MCTYCVLAWPFDEPAVYEAPMQLRSAPSSINLETLLLLLCCIAIYIVVRLKNGGANCAEVLQRLQRQLVPLNTYWQASMNMF